jgi:transcriptional regulator with XRE-family HTH domain
MGRTDGFGTTLRAYRERLSPQLAGIRPTSPAHRRVPGLRRDELARLAGVSEDHLKRLEQGRRRPSSGTVDALARALRLSHGEHERLSLLAGFAAPRTSAPGRVPREITAPARRMLNRVPEVPVCVCDASWTVLEGNRHWTELVCGGDVPGPHARNVAWRLFTEQPTNLMRSAESLAGFKSSVAADLRSAVLRYPRDPRLRDLVADLRTASADFTALWSTADAGGYHPDRMTLDHQELGSVRMDKDVLAVEPGDLRVVVFTIPDQAYGQEAAASTGSM